MKVSLKNITKIYGKNLAVNNLSLEIDSGSMHFILGPSGCGKTTTLRILAGLENSTSGKIFFGSKDVTSLSAAERGIGMVFQNYALWPHMTVKQNIEYGLKLKNLSKETIRNRLDASLAMTRLEKFINRLPSQLSGGQQQRVALARALAIRPSILLLDEPLSNLDAKLRTEMRDNISRIHDETKITTLYVTHDQKEALSMGTHITVMENGKEIQTGPPKDLYNRPKTPFLAKFIGETNLLEGEYLGRDDNNLHKIKTSLGNFSSSYDSKNIFVKGERVCLSIRPEDFRHHIKPMQNENQKNLFKGKFYSSHFHGESEQLQFSSPELKNHLLMTVYKESANTKWKKSQAYTLQVEESDIVVFKI
ncbi:MAG: spermidine/putrescine ABC transporter ATP-binding protein [Zetaproteobacteria bacterium]|nr:spermidine/putrescine ABC transporter ATP-binding protein [Pseudobdellovibrionaceae bacterium]|tara:strand:- start:728 stop:1816 length:1089 start_codon:yes stop_codon:yes gene_type:complete